VDASNERPVFNDIEPAFRDFWHLFDICNGEAKVGTYASDHKYGVSNCSNEEARKQGSKACGSSFVVMMMISHHKVRIRNGWFPAHARSDVLT
jgi:hypothetical protein